MKSSVIQIVVAVLGLVLVGCSIWINDSVHKTDWSVVESVSESRKKASRHGQLVRFEQAALENSKETAKLRAELQETRRQREAERKSREKKAAFNSVLKRALRYSGCCALIGVAISFLATQKTD